MPYKVVKTKGGYGVKNTQTGKFKSKDTTSSKAEKQRKLLEGVEHGTIKTKKKK